MAKPRTVHICSECGWESPKWVGQCRECGAWGTLEESVSVPLASGGNSSSIPKAAAKPGPIISLDRVQVEEAPATATGIGEFDRVLGGGVVPGSVILLAGEPGVGKSTLLLDVAARFARRAEVGGFGPVLYVTGEESISQVKRRAERIGALSPSLLLASETDVANTLWHFEQTQPSLLIVDSVQTMTTSAIDSGAGSVAQVKAVASLVIQEAKRSSVPTILVGHVTKDGSIAGPRTLEHLVDVVCQFEGDRGTPLRLLRAAKNRYGATDEVGCFLLGDSGIEEVTDPSRLFTSGTRGEAPGSCVTVSLDGHRPLLTELQALVAPGTGGSPRRATSGLDSSRIAMILAVIQSHLGMDLSNREVYVSTVGGAKTTEPAVDLAVAIAICSAVRGKAPLVGTVAIGEVGLTSEIRGCSGIERRLLEAARLGWKRALIPASQMVDLKMPESIDVVGVTDLKDALRHVLS
ncbi:DNA repair protein RadA [Actinomycetaceae bacterium MB13-C1-2]|nr:DNA repair protein RadA [Actinomycetaceae bacterium MB13-C1-2]